MSPQPTPSFPPGLSAGWCEQVKPTTFPDALRDRRVSLHIDNRGNITSVSDSPALVFGFRPTSLVGRNLSHVVDVFEGLPETGGVDGMDMQQLLMAFVHRWVKLWLRLQAVIDRCTWNQQHLFKRPGLQGCLLTL